MNHSRFSGHCGIRVPMPSTLVWVLVQCRPRRGCGSIRTYAQAGWRQNVVHPILRSSLPFTLHSHSHHTSLPTLTHTHAHSHAHILLTHTHIHSSSCALTAVLRHTHFYHTLPTLACLYLLSHSPYILWHLHILMHTYSYHTNTHIHTCTCSEEWWSSVRTLSTQVPGYMHCMAQFS